MTNDRDDGPDAARAAFEARLRTARKAHEKPLAEARRGSAMGLAFRLSTEFVAGILVGAGMGWVLDEWLGTSPWLLIVFFFLGAAAGVFNVFRTAQQMNLAFQQEAEGAGSQTKQAQNGPDEK